MWPSTLGFRPGGPRENADGLSESENRRRQRIKRRRPRELISRDAGGVTRGGSFSGGSAVKKKVPARQKMQEVP